MITASQLAGFFAAHAIWTVSDGDMLAPILGYTTEDDEQHMERLVVDDDLAASVVYGQQKLESNDMDAIDAVLIYDARIPVGTEKMDAIVIEMRSYFSPESAAIIAVPYTPKAAGSFLVHRPKLLEWLHCEDFDRTMALQSFFEGVDDHEQGATLWKACLDPSK
jgi:hypothetical protein